MDRQLIITIGRSFGSGGREIGERLAKALGIGFYDRNLIDMAAKKSGLDRSVVGNADEKLIGRFLELAPSIDLIQENTARRRK